MKVDPHQFEPRPLGLMAVMLLALKVAVWSDVKTSQLLFDRSVSE